MNRKSVRLFLPKTCLSMNALATSVNFVLRACCRSCTFAILLPLPKLPILEGI